MNRIGIMQGRLSPIGGRAQECPIATWRDEFVTAKALGFDLIEWVVNLSSVDANPLLVDPDAVRAIALDSGVGVASVCADFFVECALMNVSPQERAATIELFGRTVTAAAAIGADTVSVPLLERNAVSNRSDLLKRAQMLDEVIAGAVRQKVRVAIEVDLPATELVEIIDQLNVSVCFDLGNAAVAGLDVPSEIAALAHRIAVVHVKDRTATGASVALGEGCVAFDRAFLALRGLGYTGPLILETPRGPAAVDSAGGNLAFVRRHIGSAALA